MTSGNRSSREMSNGTEPPMRYSSPMGGRCYGCGSTSLRKRRHFGSRRLFEADRFRLPRMGLGSVSDVPLKFQSARRPLTKSAGSTPSAAATRTIVSKVGEPFPSSRCEMYVRCTPAISARASWLTGGSSLSRASRSRCPNARASASLDVDRAGALAISAIRVRRSKVVYRKLPESPRESKRQGRTR